MDKLLPSIAFTWSMSWEETSPLQLSTNSDPSSSIKSTIVDGLKPFMASKCSKPFQICVKQTSSKYIIKRCGKYTLCIYCRINLWKKLLRLWLFDILPLTVLPTLYQMLQHDKTHFLSSLASLHKPRAAARTQDLDQSLVCVPSRTDEYTVSLDSHGASLDCIPWLCGCESGVWRVTKKASKKCATPPFGNHKLSSFCAIGGHNTTTTSTIHNNISWHTKWTHELIC